MDTAKLTEDGPSPEEYLAGLLEIGREIDAATRPGGSVLQQLFEDRDDATGGGGERRDMKEIGIRELKASASEIMRAVRDERAEYVVTHRGKPVAMIVPYEEAVEDDEAPGDWWARMQEIGRLMDAETPHARSALQQLREDREAS